MYMVEDSKARMPFGEKMIYKASRTLQSKSGHGILDRIHVNAAKKAVQEVDYWPFAMDRIAEMGRLIKDAREDGDYYGFTRKLIKVVVHLKSTAGTYGYDVISDLTAIMLEFLELSTELDDDVIDLVEGHQKTLSYLVHSDIKSTTEEESRVLRQELYEACRRYRKKMHIDE